MKFVFLHLDKNLAVEDPSDILHMRSLIRGEDQNIIQVSKHKLVEHIPEAH